MNHSKRLVISCAAMLLGFFMACAKQTSNDDANGNGTGATPSIFSGGAGSGSGSGTGSTNTGTGSTGSTEQYPNGLKPVDAKVVTDTLAAPETCQGAAVEAEAEPANLLFLVDVSNSMNYPSPTTGGQTKWAITQAALKTAVAGLPATFGVGVSFYPNMNIDSNTLTARPASACVNTAQDVPVAAADADQVMRVQGALDAVIPPSMAATPTHDAMNLAIEQFRKSTLSGRKYIVLITDGQPTQREGCIGTGSMKTPEPAQPIIDAIAAAAALDPQIKTFVVGSPGSEKSEATGEDVRAWLSQAARAGGTDTLGCKDTAAPYCHFDLSQASDFGLALADALKGITRAVITCNFGVIKPDAGMTIDPNAVSMFFSDGSGSFWRVVPDPDGKCTTGWAYTDASKTEVVICGDTCTKIQDTPTASLNVLFGCATVNSIM